jgi:outer membrane protein assembly factor BamB
LTSRSSGNRSSAIRALALLSLSALALSGCARRELILTGERFDIRTPLEASLPEGEAAGAVAPLKIVGGGPAEDQALAISLPAPRSLADWPQRGAGPGHLLPHLSLSASPVPVWRVSIGAGNDRKHRITADPVVGGGKVYTLDSRARVMAHTTGGKPVWAADLTPPSDRAGEASGGGLALAGGRLFVTSGFGTVSALDAATGQVVWTQDIGGVGSAAPAVVGEMLYVMSRDNRAWGIRTSDGKVIWEVAGTPAPSGYVGGPGAAVDGRIAVLPFAGGELVSVLRLSGVRSWSANVAGERAGKVYAQVLDIGGDPVLDGNVLYAANSSGRLAALNAGNGERLWTATEGTFGTVVPAGGSLFLVSDNAELVRLDAATGARIWGTPLPDYVKAKPKKRKAAYAHYGPILAGGRLLVASNDGVMRFFDPVSGALTGQATLPGGAASNPVVAGGTLYIVTGKGDLVAWR